MYVEKFLQQVHRKMSEQGITNSKLRETRISIYEGKTEIFKIDSKGSMFYTADKQFANVVDKLHEKIQPIVCDVDEYLRAMENGTDLKARDFNMSYRKIAEFNEVVFAGTEHRNGSFVSHSRKNRHKKALKNGMNRNNSFDFSQTVTFIPRFA